MGQNAIMGGHIEELHPTRVMALCSLKETLSERWSPTLDSLYRSHDFSEMGQLSLGCRDGLLWPYDSTNIPEIRDVSNVRLCFPS